MLGQYLLFHLTMLLAQLSLLTSSVMLSIIWATVWHLYSNTTVYIDNGRFPRAIPTGSPLEVNFEETFGQLADCPAATAHYSNDALEFLKSIIFANPTCIFSFFLDYHWLICKLHISCLFVAILRFKLFYAWTYDNSAIILNDWFTFFSRLPERIGVNKVLGRMRFGWKIGY